MSIPAKCPLGHGPVEFIEFVNAGELVSAYRASFNVDISQMLDDHAKISFCRCAECGIRFFDPATPGPPKLYAELSRIPWYYISDKEEYRLASRRIGKGQKVLEIGCGRGAFARYLPEPDYIGLEYNMDAVKTACAAGLDVRPESVEDFSKSHENKFDVVCSFQVLEHVPDPSSFISACVACTRPGGIVMFGVPNCGGYLGAQPDDLLNMPPHHLTWWTADVFWNIAPQYGLEMIAAETEPLSNKSAYADTKALRFMMKTLKQTNLFLFIGIKYRLLKAAARVSRRFMLIGLDDPYLRPPGHSILVVMRKT